MSVELKNYNPTKAAEVLINIRSDFKPISDLTKVFKGEVPYSQELEYYFFEFFCELSIKHIKEYMTEQEISREQIISVFNKLPNFARKHDFKRALENGCF
jgi:hypothetical protein